MDIFLLVRIVRRIFLFFRMTSLEHVSLMPFDSVIVVRFKALQMNPGAPLKERTTQRVYLLTLYKCLAWKPRSRRYSQFSFTYPFHSKWRIGTIYPSWTFKVWKIMLYYIVSSFLGDLRMLLHNISKCSYNIAAEFYIHFIL